MKYKIKNPKSISIMFPLYKDKRTVKLMILKTLKILKKTKKKFENVIVDDGCPEHSGKVKDPFDDFTGPQNVGHLFIVIKSELFVGKKYNKRIEENIKTIKKLPKIKGVKEIFYPGQNKYQRYKSNLKKEIKISKNIFIEIKSLLK